MTTQAESKLSRKIMSALRAQPATFCFKIHGSAHMVAGLPDIVACVQGQFLGFETKMPGKESNLSPRQHYIHSQIRQAQGDVFVVSCVEDALAVWHHYDSRFGPNRHSGAADHQ